MGEREILEGGGTKYVVNPNSSWLLVRVDRTFPIGSLRHKPRQRTLALRLARDRITGRDNCVLQDSTMSI